MRSQREYKVYSVGLERTGLTGVWQRLLERYNPLVELTGEERIEATARRVGLNMPVEARDE
ncbi:hypothetical protein J3R83DRAFT_962 [Lanmaoa asiatica]|nr:hypothetical protein J3R83DRAFT_962 [Lanmaoa asiatica]